MITISKTEIVEHSLRATEQSIPLAAYGRALSPRKWHVLLLAVVAMAVTFLIIQQQAAYKASVTVSLSTSAAEKFASQLAIEQILKSDNALQTILSKTEAEYSPGVLRDNITVELVSGTTFVNIYVRDSRAGRAKKIADLAGLLLVKATKGNDRKYEEMESQAKAIDTELDLLKKISGRGSSPEIGEDPLSLNLHSINEAISAAKAELSRIEGAGIDANSRAIYSLLLNQRILALEQQKPELIDERLGILTQQNQLLALRGTLQVELDKVRTTRVLTPAARPTSLDTSNMGRSIFMAGLAALLIGTALALAIKPGDDQDIIG